MVLDHFIMQVSEGSEKKQLCGTVSRWYFVDKTGRAMAVIMPFISQGPSFSCKRLEQFIYPVILREVKDISRKCVLVQTDTHTYLCRIPNFIESD